MHIYVTTMHYILNVSDGFFRSFPEEQEWLAEVSTM